MGSEIYIRDRDTARRRLYRSNTLLFFMLMLIAWTGPAHLLDTCDALRSRHFLRREARGSGPVPAEHSRSPASALCSFALLFLLRLLVDASLDPDHLCI